MAITRDELLHLAKLSSLHLSEEEIVHLGKDLDGILDYV
jgi:Asp-tRNA(Asn)/Glu-tRNA(Gln) amidotransferase C subunit